MSKPRPTPETDAVTDKAYNFLNDGDIDAVEADFARKLERERDEAREELARMQAMAASVADIIAKRNAMFGAILDAHGALENLIIAKRGGMQPANALIDATFAAKAAVKKLKPFIP
jgi:hypothetical protein